MKAMNLIIIIFVSLLILSCNDNNNPLDFSPLEMELPLLEDEIPYDILGSGKILFERIGPDGEVYSGFYVIDLDGQNSWSLNTRLSRHMCLSQDGKNIALVHSPSYASEYNIYTMDIYGNDIKKLTSILGLVNCPVWNTNSDMIIFWGGGVNNEFDRIFTVDLEGTELKEIKSFNYGSGISSYAPSGRMSISNINEIIYVVNNGPFSGLCKINLSSNNFEVLIEAPEGENFESPRFSPDFQSIAYLSITRDSNWEYESMSIRILDRSTNITKEIYSSDIGYKEWSDGSGDL